MKTQQAPPLPEELDRLMRRMRWPYLPGQGGADPASREISPARP